MIYWPALAGPFLTWDDTQHILLNPWLVQGKAGYFWTHAHYGMYIPVTYTLWSWVYGLSSSPVAFHTLNIILHICNSWMVFRLIQRFYPALEDRYVLTAALVFACHPLQVEAVAWISGGRDVLAAFFALAAWLLATTRFKNNFLSKISPIGSVLLFTLSLTAKPSLLLLPVAVWWLQIIGKPALIVRRSVIVGWTSLSALSGVIAVYMQSEWADKRLDVVFWERLLIAFDTIGFYIGQVIWPLTLAADYGRDPRSVIDASLFVSSLVMVGLFAGFFIWLKQRSGEIAIGVAGFFILILFPVLGLVPFAAQTISTVFDRYMYFAMFAVALIVALFLKCKPVFQGAIIGLMCLTALSFENTWKWRSNSALASDMIAKNPRSYDGFNNLALVEIEAQNWNQAKQLLLKATSIKPDSAVSWSNLGYVYWSQSDLAAIFADLDSRLQSPAFLERNGSEPQALGLMFRMGARAYSSVRKTDLARDYYCRALKYDPLDNDLRGEVQGYLKDGEGC